MLSGGRCYVSLKKTSDVAARAWSDWLQSTDRNTRAAGVEPGGGAGPQDGQVDGADAGASGAPAGGAGAGGRRLRQAGAPGGARPQARSPLGLEAHQ
eukprot:9466892-Pyramimonas_sp.AAC.2